MAGLTMPLPLNILWRPSDIRTREASLPLYIKDAATTDLVTTLAALSGVSKKEAVRLAVKAELDRRERPAPLRELLEQFWSEHPLPRPTGLKADKAFFDELWGER